MTMFHSINQAHQHEGFSYNGGCTCFALGKVLPLFYTICTAPPLNFFRISFVSKTLNIVALSYSLQMIFPLYFWVPLPYFHESGLSIWVPPSLTIFQIPSIP